MNVSRLGRVRSSFRRAAGVGAVLLPALAWQVTAQATQQRFPVPRSWAASLPAIAGAWFLDHAIQRWALNSRRQALTWLADRVDVGGQTRAGMPVIAVVCGLGHVLGKREFSDCAIPAAGAFAAAGAANMLLKVGVGRRRPSAPPGANLLRPFSLDNASQSFPSGHVTVAFSLATIVSEEVAAPWASPLAYGIAGLVGWSRVYRNRHWASDVIGGAVIGTLTTRLALRFLRAKRLGADEGPRLWVGTNSLVVSFALP